MQELEILVHNKDYKFNFIKVNKSYSFPSKIFRNGKLFYFTYYYPHNLKTIQERQYYDNNGNKIIDKEEIWIKPEYYTFEFDNLKTTKKYRKILCNKYILYLIISNWYKALFGFGSFIWILIQILNNI